MSVIRLKPRAVETEPVVRPVVTDNTAAASAAGSTPSAASYRKMFKVVFQSPTQGLPVRVKLEIDSPMVDQLAHGTVFEACEESVVQYNSQPVRRVKLSDGRGWVCWDSTSGGSPVLEEIPIPGQYPLHQAQSGATLLSPVVTIDDGLIYRWKKWFVRMKPGSNGTLHAWRADVSQARHSRHNTNALSQDRCNL